MDIKKLFFPLLLVFINVLIIVKAESVGGGTYFFESGLIHAVSIIFILLVLYTIRRLTYLRDATFQDIFKGLQAALILLSLVHILEYMGIRLLPEEPFEDLIDIAVVSLYLLSFLVVNISFDLIFKAHPGTPTRLSRLFPISIPLFFIFIIAIFINPAFVESIGEKNILLSLVIISLGICIITVRKMFKLQTLMSVLKPFLRYLIFSYVLIFIAILLEASEVVNVLGLERFQIIYLAHFVFYAALSFELFAFSELFHPGGLYEELKRGGYNT